MSAVYDCSKRDSRADGLAAAAGAVRSSRLVVLPTDTVYGIGCDAFDSGAVELDGGSTGDAVPSTMVDLTGTEPVILREGAVSKDAVAEVLGVPAESLA